MGCEEINPTAAEALRLIGECLSDQEDLSAVDRFAQSDRGSVGTMQERSYSALMPASPPGPGQQLAFEVDLDRCSGCKACVAACHALNGLDRGETWRDVGLLVGGTSRLPVLQHVTTACHHCLEPACLAACPVNAYEKDPATGIVRHLDDQCFGCQYCTLACPYDVPKYHASKGIVRKCDMCGDRLRAGEAPACVQACPHEAITIRVVDRAEVQALAAVGEFLPTAFDPGYTLPTTRFRSVRPGALRAADGDRGRPEHGHAPLVLMLVLTQLSVGGFAVEGLARVCGRADGLAGPAFPQACLALGLLGLAASVAHLGRPQYAYRALLGLRHSWLSREVLALGLFAQLALAFVAAEAFEIGPREFRSGLLVAVVMAGAAGVASSVMVYHVVRRPFWRAGVSGWKFAGTASVLGLATALACLGLVGFGEELRGGLVSAVALALFVASAAKLIFERRDCRGEEKEGPLGQTARLLRGPLRHTLGLRRILGGLGGLVLPALVIAGSGRGEAGMIVLASLLALVCSVGGELVERTLFFAAVSRPRMPGGLPS